MRKLVNNLKTMSKRPVWAQPIAMSACGMALAVISLSTWASTLADVPEPSSLALLAGGVAAVVIAARFKRRK